MNTNSDLQQYEQQRQAASAPHEAGMCVFVAGGQTAVRVTQHPLQQQQPSTSINVQLELQLLLQLHSLEWFIDEVHGGPQHMHERCRVYQQAHTPFLNQLVKLALLICRAWGKSTGSTELAV